MPVDLTSNLSYAPDLGDTSYFRIFLLLIMKNVFEKLVLYPRRRENTSIISDWLKVFLKNSDIILKIPEAAGISIYWESDFMS